MIVNVLTDEGVIVEIIQDNLPNVVEVFESATPNVVEIVTTGPQGPVGPIGPVGPSPATGSFATTGSNIFRGNQVISGSLIVTQEVSSSFSGSGANLYNIPASAIVGLNLSQISSGSVSASISEQRGLQVNTNVTATSFTGSLLGTASYALQALSASYADVTSSLGYTPQYRLFTDFDETGYPTTTTEDIARSGDIKLRGGDRYYTTEEYKDSNAGTLFGHITSGNPTGYIAMFSTGSGHSTGNNNMIIGNVPGAATSTPQSTFIAIKDFDYNPWTDSRLLYRFQNGYFSGNRVSLFEIGTDYIRLPLYTSSRDDSGSTVNNFLFTDSTGVLKSRPISAITTFPYTGSALITGSLTVTGSLNVTGITTIGSPLYVNSYLYCSYPIEFGSTGEIHLGGDGSNYFRGTRNSQWASDIKIKYATNLSASYDNRTLVDKEYVDSKVANIFPYTGSAIITGSLGVTGSLNVTGGITGSLLGTASYATNAVTASYVIGGGSTFPYTGSALITGSLIVTGSLSQGEPGNIASGQNSHAQGEQTLSSGIVSHAEGYLTTASGYASHAEGQGSLASSNYSHAEGYSTRALANHSHAEGSETIASGYASHAEGEATLASGYASHAEGRYTTSSGQYSHAEGEATLASNQHSHAEGFNTRASALGSHSEGIYTTASGNYSHAEGISTQALSSYSHAEGIGTVALGNGTHVQGLYNISSSVAGAFIHGNGTSDSTRSNLIYAHDSIVEITGSLNVSGSVTGSLFGTSSWAVSSSYSENSTNASYATTASYAPDYVLTSTTSSMLNPYVLTSTTSSMNVLSSSYALTASYVIGGVTFPYTGSAIISGSLEITGSLRVSGAISASDYQTIWSDFSLTTSIVGWSSTTRKVVRYMRVGKLGIIEYDIFGTSNSATVATFTIPFTASGLQVTQSNNNQCFNTATVPSGQAAVASGSSLVVCNYYSTAVAFGTAWSGNKGVRGVLTLEIE